MATANQLAQYCLDHGYVLQQKGSNMTLVQSLVGQVNWLWVGIAAGAYTVGRVGLPQAWTDIKGIWTWIRSKV